MKYEWYITTGLVLLAALLLVSCGDDSMLPPAPVVIPKAHYVVTSNPVVNLPGQGNLYLTDVRDAETGAEYLLIQNGYNGGVAIIQKPPKPVEKPQ